MLLLQGSPRNGSCKRGEVAAQAVDFDPTRPIARVVLAIFEVVPTYARVMDAAGDPVATAACGRLRRCGGCRQSGLARPPFGSRGSRSRCRRQFDQHGRWTTPRQPVSGVR
jgi:hypothetical protein